MACGPPRGHGDNRLHGLTIIAEPELAVLLRPPCGLEARAELAPFGSSAFEPRTRRPLRTCGAYAPRPPSSSPITSSTPADLDNGRRSGGGSAATYRDADVRELSGEGPARTGFPRTVVGPLAGAVVAGVRLRAGQRNDLRRAPLTPSRPYSRGLGVPGVLTAPLAACYRRCLLAACYRRCLLAAAPPLPGGQPARQPTAVRQLACGAPTQPQLEHAA